MYCQACKDEGKWTIYVGETNTVSIHKIRCEWNWLIIYLTRLITLGKEFA